MRCKCAPLLESFSCNTPPLCENLYCICGKIITNTIKCVLHRLLAHQVLTKHDVVGGVPMHAFLVQARREEFDVSSTTVNVLLVFHSKLDDERLALVADVIKTGRQRVEAGVLAGLKTWNRNDTLLYRVSAVDVMSVSGSSQPPPPPTPHTHTHIEDVSPKLLWE